MSDLLFSNCECPQSQAAALEGAEFAWKSIRVETRVQECLFMGKANVLFKPIRGAHCSF